MGSIKYGLEGYQPDIPKKKKKKKKEVLTPEPKTKKVFIGPADINIKK